MIGVWMLGRWRWCLVAEIEVHDLAGLDVRRHPERGWQYQADGGQWITIRDLLTGPSTLIDWLIDRCEQEFPAPPRTVTLSDGRVFTERPDDGASNRRPRWWGRRMVGWRDDRMVAVRFLDEVSTNGAARILNVSEPYVRQMCDDGLLPFRMVGTHRRFLRRHVELRRRIMLAEMREAADELTAEAQRLGIEY